VAIKRPKKYRGKEFPRGDCGANHHWLANRLSCENNVCTVMHIGDRCELPSETFVDRLYARWQVLEEKR
jgi:hypothetical protein